MDNSTINLPDSQSLNLHEDTQIYLCASPRVRAFEIDILETVGNLLNFRASGLRIAREIIRRQGGEDVSIELTHEKFAEALWPDLAPDARIRKFTRSLKNYREDMDASGFRFVEPRRQRPKQTEEGFRGQPTSYEPAMYWQLSNAIRERAREVDFFAFPVEQRRRKERTELKAILRALKCVRITRSKEQDDVKPPNPGPPCKCNCASCVQCKAKASESDSLPARAAEVRIDKSSVEKKIDTALDILFDAGQDWANLNLQVNDFTRKVWMHIEQNEMRLLEAVKRHNAPRVKMNGGQSK